MPAPTPLVVDSPSRSFAPRVQGNDDEESTRLQSIEQLQAVAALRAAKGPGAKGVTAGKDPPSQTLKSQGVATLEAAALLASQQPPAFGAPPLAFGAPPPSMPAPSMPAPMFGAPPPEMGAPQMIVPGPGAPPEAPPAAAAQESWIARNWREASGPKKALTFLMLPLIWAVWVIFTDPPPTPRPTRAAASASAAPSSAPNAGSVAPPPPSVEPPPPVTTSSAKAAGTSAPQTTTGAKTPQREAADAVAAGAYDRAAKLYEDLAKANPSVPAYAEAARIMKAKAKRQ